MAEDDREDAGLLIQEQAGGEIACSPHNRTEPYRELKALHPGRGATVS